MKSPRTHHKPIWYYIVIVAALCALLALSVPGCSQRDLDTASGSASPGDSVSASNGSDNVQSSESPDSDLSSPENTTSAPASAVSTPAAPSTASSKVSTPKTSTASSKVSTPATSTASSNVSTPATSTSLTSSAGGSSQGVTEKNAGGGLALAVCYMYNHRIYHTNLPLSPSDIGDSLGDSFYRIVGVDPSESVAIQRTGYYQCDYVMDDSFVWNGNTYVIPSPISGPLSNVNLLYLGTVGTHNVYAMAGVDPSQQVEINIMNSLYADAVRQ